MGRRFAAGVNGIGLALYPGSYNDVVAAQASEFAVMWPTLIPADLITQRVVLAGELIAQRNAALVDTGVASDGFSPPPWSASRDWTVVDTALLPLGELMGCLLYTSRCV